jgi:hypothetical protein
VILASFSDAHHITSTPEYQFFRGKFSSGVTIRELCSIAKLAAGLAKIKPPPRDAKRNWPNLMHWLIERWSIVYPWLAVMNLLDSDGRAIDGYREFFERMQ